MFDQQVRTPPKTGRISIDTDRMLVSYDGVPLDQRLSVRDIQALAYLHERTGRVCRREDLGVLLWGEDHDPAAVHKFISRLRAKLPDELGQRIMNVRGMGYRFEDEPDTAARHPWDRRRYSYSKVLAGSLLALAGACLVGVVVLSFVFGDGESAPAAAWLIREDFNSIQPSGYSDAIRPFIPVAYNDGELIVRKEVDGIRRLGSVGLSDSRDDSSLSVDVRFVGETFNRWVVLGCRRDLVSAGPGMSSYWLRIDPTTKEARISWIDKGRERPISQVMLDRLRTSEEWNTIELICVGPSLTAKVNGHVVLSVQDSALVSGQSWFGVVTDTPDMDVEVRVDNLVLVAVP